MRVTWVLSTKLVGCGTDSRNLFVLGLCHLHFVHGVTCCAVYFWRERDTETQRQRHRDRDTERQYGRTHLRYRGEIGSGFRGEARQVGETDCPRPVRRALSHYKEGDPCLLLVR